MPTYKVKKFALGYHVDRAVVWDDEFNDPWELFMPLNKSGSKKAVGQNIKAELAAGRPKKQAIAIALSVQRKAGGGGRGGRRGK